MEPPAKRLRILQSVEVDEENLDYIHAKQKQQQKFKGRLESIFAKYESMHESMSDEIDMRQNKVVVDRGHLRRLVRQVNRKETFLLDHLGMAAAHEPEDDSGDEGENGDSEDELAPTQRPKANKRRFEDTEQGQQATPGAQDMHSQLDDSNQLETRDAHTFAPSPIQAGPQQLSNTSNPAANLLQLVQFPQTPAGQQAQTAFYTTLAQTINRAVQQAVAPLFSTILPHTPNVQLPFATAQPMSTTPASAGDKIVPATDPKWFFPPLSSESRKPQAGQSHPTAAATDNLAPENTSTGGIGNIVFQQESDKTEINIAAELSQSPGFAETTPTQSKRRSCRHSASRPQRKASPRVEVQRNLVHSRRRFHFTKEDDIYISKRKQLDQLTWLDIQKSQEKWSDWPLRVFQRRWNSHLKGKRLHLANTTTTSPNPPNNVSQTKPKKVHGQNRSEPRSSSQLHHFPTPSSLEHGDNQRGSNHSQQQHTNEVLPSSSHFDDDEIDLLSLAGAETDEEPLPIGSDEQSLRTSSEDIVLPSIEMTEFVDEGTLQQGLLEDLSTRGSIDVNVKIEPLLSSPTNRLKRRTKPHTSRTVPDSENEDAEGLDSELEVAAVSSTIKAKNSFVCTVCQESFVTARNLALHHHNPLDTLDKSLQQQCGCDDLEGDNEVQALITPYIKRELSKSPPAAFAFSTAALQTPRTVPHHSGIHSSSSKSTSKLDRKTFLKQVKQSWTRKSSPGSKTLPKRRSFHTVPMKRAWVGDAQSEDELA
ncbi:hypothetical protein BKA66DRAFT_508343 [Pyrenochaeta sp. MPI-SDFR-AT-0127]|nr:hypothetical protein BKA66DRAFT_508343 [Pyrenochaeta sp. MPI-SDFR-AT-0127]